MILTAPFANTDTKSFCSPACSLYDQRVRNLVTLFMLQKTVNKPFYRIWKIDLQNLGRSTSL